MSVESKITSYMQCEYGSVVFRFHGGEYIEIGFIDDACDFHAEDVINVFDYEAGETTINTLEQFRQRCIQWIEREDDAS